MQRKRHTCALVVATLSITALIVAPASLVLALALHVALAHDAPSSVAAFAVTPAAVALADAFFTALAIFAAVAITALIITPASVSFTNAVLRTPTALADVIFAAASAFSTNPSAGASVAVTHAPIAISI
jgi:hypothetical protein